MKIFVILGHPYNGSLNNAIARTAVSALEGYGHKVFFHDLYREGFDPVISGNELAGMEEQPDMIIERHRMEITDSDGIVVIHPNWWGQPPAILKGWIDRVLRQGTAYEFEEGDKGGGVPKGLLKAETALIINTSNTGSEREMKVFKDPLDTIWKNCVFGFCGVRKVIRKNFGIVADSTPEQRRRWLEETEDLIRIHFGSETGGKT